jgi:ribosomal protein L9
MQIILLERVEKLGQLGDVVTVKPGYARNYLLPTGKALRANKANLEKFEAERADREARNADAKSAAESKAKAMDGLTVALVRAASEMGQLFGSVSSRDIADAVSAAGHELDKRQVNMDKSLESMPEGWFLPHGGSHAHTYCMSREHRNFLTPRDESLALDRHAARHDRGGRVARHAGQRAGHGRRRHPLRRPRKLDAPHRLRREPPAHGADPRLPRVGGRGRHPHPPRTGRGRPRGGTEEHPKARERRNQPTVRFRFSSGAAKK